MVSSFGELDKFFRGLFVEDRKTVIHNTVIAGVTDGIEDCPNLDKVLLAYRAWELGCGDIVTLYKLVEREDGVQIIQDFINVMESHHKHHGNNQS